MGTETRITAPTFKERNVAATRQDIEGWFDREVEHKV